MTKKQLKERALLLASFSFLLEGFRILKIDPFNIDLIRIDDVYDLKIISAFKKLNNLRKTFTSETILNFFNKRILSIEDKVDYDCQPLYIGLILLWFFIKFNQTKDIVLCIKLDEIEKILKYYSVNYEITECTIDKSIEIFLAIYPDKKGLIEFYKLSNKFPFNLKKGEHQ